MGATAGQRRFRGSGMRGEASGDPGAPPGPPGLPSLPPLTSLFPNTNHPFASPTTAAAGYSAKTEQPPKRGDRGSGMSVAGECGPARPAPAPARSPAGGMSPAGPSQSCPRQLLGRPTGAAAAFAPLQAASIYRLPRTAGLDISSFLHSLMPQIPFGNEGTMKTGVMEK